MKTDYKSVIITMHKLVPLILYTMCEKEDNMNKKDSSPTVENRSLIVNSGFRFNLIPSPPPHPPFLFFTCSGLGTIVWYRLGRLDRYHGDLDKPPLRHSTRWVRPCIWANRETHTGTHTSLSCAWGSSLLQVCKLTHSYLQKEKMVIALNRLHTIEPIARDYLLNLMVKMSYYFFKA